MKKAVLFRHGEAENRSFSGMDQDRILTEAGRECFRKNALALKGRVCTDGALFFSSSALRAALSLRILMETLETDPESARQEDFLYQTGADGICRTIQTLPDERDTVFLVLHNPAVSEAVSLLTGHDFFGFRAGEGVVLDFDAVRWQDAGPSTLSGCCFLRRDS